MEGQEFKKVFVFIQKRLGEIRAKLKTEIKSNLRNINQLDDMVVQLSGDCEDLMWKAVSLKSDVEDDYYVMLNELASDYTETEIPIHVKASKEYRQISKRRFFIDNLISEIKRTQTTVNNRRYGLTNAIKVQEFIREVSTG